MIGHLGKIYKPKNHHFLIKVFAEVVKVKPDAVLLLVGDGEMRDEIKKGVEELELGDNVIFAGMQREVHNFLSAMDVFVFPSIWEGMPLSLIEAQASGLKCISSTSIDSESNVTGKVRRVELTASVNDWVDMIMGFREYDRVYESNENIKLIKENGFDSRTNALVLEKIYRS